MGREQRRKEQFKNKNKKMEPNELDTNIKLATAIKLISFILILLFVIYYVIAVFVTKELDISNKNKETSTITDENTANTVSNKILASNIFDQKEETYYVYFYDFTDEDELVKNVMSSISETTVYKVDTNSSLNANYVTEEKGNKKATTIDELKVKNPTVIKIDGDKIIEYYEGSSNIYEGLKD